MGGIALYHFGIHRMDHTRFLAAFKFVEYHIIHH